MGDESPQDAVARMKAEGDQVIEATKEFGRQTWAYFSALRDAGFGATEALTLTATWIQAFFAAAASSGGDE